MEDKKDREKGSQDQSNKDAGGKNVSDNNGSIPGLDDVSKATEDKPKEKKLARNEEELLDQNSELHSEKVTLSLQDLNDLIEIKMKQRGVNVYANSENPEERALALNTYDPDDELETPAVYFSHIIGHFLAGDRRNNREIPHPFNVPVKFTWWSSEKSGSNEIGWSVVQISRFMTRSKKEEVWMDNHSANGISFYKYMPDISKIDTSNQMFLDEASNRLKLMGDDNVLMLTKNKENQKKYGIKPLPSKQDMRRNLLPLMLDIVKSESQLRQNSRAMENIQSAQDLGFNVKVSTVS